MVKSNAEQQTHFDILLLLLFLLRSRWKRGWQESAQFHDLKDSFIGTKHITLPDFTISLSHYLGEESLSYLPSHMMAVNAEVYAGERIVLDTIENAKGLEQLIVISIGLDGGQDGDRLTRARLYQGITRAQLVALVVNEFVEDGLLAFLSKVRHSCFFFPKWPPTLLFHT